MNKIVFLIQTNDQKGLLSGITSYFYRQGFNILSCQQHTDSQAKKYFMRIELDSSDLKTTQQQLLEEFG